MESIDLEPRYSTSQIPGKCLKCLAEQELDSCLRQLLVIEGQNKEVQERYAALLSFLKAPESKNLRDETEKYLAEGKEVKIQIYYQQGKVKCELNLEGEGRTNENCSRI